MNAGAFVQLWAKPGKSANDYALMLAVKFQIGTGRVLSRTLYLARLTYWALRHRSINTARWVVAFEGRSW